MKKVIGIIGGNGVAATNKLCQMIEEELTNKGALRDCDHPEMIIWQATKAPSRSLFLEKRGDSFIPEYIRIAQILEDCGVTDLCICCNTAHYAFDEISKNVKTPIINLIEEVAQTVKSLNLSSIGLMASDGCLQGKVYEKYLNIVCPDIKIFYPDKQHQMLVTKGICNIKNKNRFSSICSEKPQDLFKKVKNHLLTSGAEKIICGCTDIRVDYNEDSNIDSLECLKQAILRRVNER